MNGPFHSPVVQMRSLRTDWKKGVLVCGEGWVGTRKMRSSQMFYSGPEDTDDYLLVVF